MMAEEEAKELPPLLQRRNEVGSACTVKRCCRPNVQRIVRWSSTMATPGADQAAFSAARRSAQSSTLPSRMTLLPFCTVTRIALASSSAWRLSATSILVLRFDASMRGLMLTLFVTPRSKFSWRSLPPPLRCSPRSRARP